MSSVRGMYETEILFGAVLIGILVALWLGLREPERKESTT